MSHTSFLSEDKCTSLTQGARFPDRHIFLCDRYMTKPVGDARMSNSTSAGVQELNVPSPKTAMKAMSRYLRILIFRRSVCLAPLHLSHGLNHAARLAKSLPICLMGAWNI